MQNQPAPANRQQAPPQRAWFLSPLARFRVEDALKTMGSLATSSASLGFLNTSNAQINAWQSQLELLVTEFDRLREIQPQCDHWTVLLEYEIPRRQRRIDVVLLSRNTVFVIECKIGSDRFDRADV